MRKTGIAIGLSLMSLTAFAQKKEMRNASKAVASHKYQDALKELESVESLISNEKDNVKAEFYYLKGLALFNKNTNDINGVRQAVASLNEAKKYQASASVAKSISEFASNMSQKLVSTAIEDQDGGNNKLAGDKLLEAYRMNKRDTVYLYYAASNYHGAEDYDNALKYYNKLMDLGYTGIAKQYFAIEKETGEKHMFNDASQRNLMLKSRQYENPTEEVTKDVRPQILHYLAYIYIMKEDYDNAIKTVDDALKNDPNNTALLRAKADVVYQLGDKVQYKEIMQRIITLDPNNAELFFNLGVGSTELGEVDEALDFYNKAIKLDDSYYAAYLNAAVLILNKDDFYVEEMNKLTMSPADMKKYDILQAERKQLFQSAIPYLENALRLEEDKEIMRTLANVYMQLGEDDKADALMQKIND